MIDRIWGWSAGISAAVLLCFIAIAGWNMSRASHDGLTAGNAPQQTPVPATERNASRLPAERATTGTASR